MPIAWSLLENWFRVADVPPDHEVFELLADDVLGEFAGGKRPESLMIPAGLMSVVFIACSNPENGAFLKCVSTGPFPAVLYHVAIQLGGKDTLKLAFPLFCLTIRPNLPLEWITPDWVDHISTLCPYFAEDLCDLLVDRVCAVIQQLADFPWSSYFAGPEASPGFKVFFVYLAFELQQKLPEALDDYPELELIPLLCDFFDPRLNNNDHDNRLAGSVLSLLLGCAERQHPAVIECIQEHLTVGELAEYIDSRAPDDDDNCARFASQLLHFLETWTEPSLLA
jgi:hypothetical protein